jgi:hypothetical protein
MSSSYYRNGSLLRSSRVEPKGGVTDLRRRQTIEDTIDIRAINNQFDTYTNSTSNSTIVTWLQSNVSNSFMFATPVYNAAFENMSPILTYGAGNHVTSGRFAYDMMTPDIVPSNFPGCTQGCVWYAMSFWKNSSDHYLGTVYLNHRQLKADGRGLKSIFYPPQLHFTEALIMHGSGSANGLNFQELHNGPGSGTLFSSRAQISAQGYFSSTKFSSDDGVWGFKQGTILDAGGSTTSGNLLAAQGQPRCFGIQNARATDSGVNVIHWGNTIIQSQTDFKCLIWSVKE